MIFLAVINIFLHDSKDYETVVFLEFINRVQRLVEIWDQKAFLSEKYFLTTWIFDSQDIVELAVEPE